MLCVAPVSALSLPSNLHIFALPNLSFKEHFSFITDEIQSEGGGGIPLGVGINNYDELCHIVLHRCIFLLAAVNGPDKPWCEDDQGPDDEIDKIPVKTEDCYR